MKKIMSIFIAIFFLSVNSYTADLQLKQSPLNPKLVTYIKNRQLSQLKKLSDNGFPLGLIPHSIQYNMNNINVIRKTAVMPAVFDLRDEGKLTSVKDQSSCGACWTFASYGSIESRWLALGLGTFDMSEQNLKNGNGFDIDHCGGGNASITTAYLVRGDGPISETDDPYDVNDGNYVSGLTPLGYIPDARFIPRDANTIKQVIYEYGAVYTDMYWDGQYYDGNNNTYYCDVSADSSTNHAVLLVGWNDTLQTAGGEGAWIIRNSWGPSFGDGGFFYISYNDTKVNSNLAFWPNRIDYEENRVIHQYDDLGAIAGIGCGNSVGYGLVKFTLEEDQKITKVGTWQNFSGSTVALKIYDNFNNGNLSGLLASVDNKLCDFPGYYTFDLSEPLQLNAGNDIYIKVEYNCPGAEYPIPVEANVDGYADPTIENGKYWVSCSGDNWTALGSDTDYQYDLCIKAYGLKITTAVQDKDGVFAPQTYGLRNYPNPFNPSTVISYQLPKAGEIELAVYNVLGKRIKTLVKGYHSAGEYKVTFEAEGLSNGVYFYKLISGDHVQVRKMILMK